MKRTLIISLSLLALVGACGVISPEPTPLPTATSIPEPTPDTPMFSDEEIKVLWIDWLKSTEYKRLGAEYDFNDKKWEYKTVTNSCFKYLDRYKAVDNSTISYLGNNKWEIVTKVSDDTFFYEVFEKIQKINPNQNNRRC